MVGVEDGLGCSTIAKNDIIVPCILIIQKIFISLHLNHMQ